MGIEFRSMARNKTRGPRCGAEHRPVRGHDHKTAAELKRRFEQKAICLRQQKEERIRIPGLG
jgi:hypothetical protein